MKTIEEIQKEYDKFECRLNPVQSLEDLKGWIKVAFDDIDENVRDLHKDQRYNKIAKLLATINNLFVFLEDREDTSYYDEDDNLIVDAYYMNKLYKRYFNDMFNATNDSNYVDMAKIADFIMKHYDVDVMAIDSKRRDLEYRQRGYGCVDNGHEATCEELHEFFDMKINEISRIKGIEKVYKM